jgi:hypothetical protein
LANTSMKTAIDVITVGKALNSASSEEFHFKFLYRAAIAQYRTAIVQLSSGYRAAQYKHTFGKSYLSKFDVFGKTDRYFNRSYRQFRSLKCSDELLNLAKTLKCAIHTPEKLITSNFGALSCSVELFVRRLPLTHINRLFFCMVRMLNCFYVFGVSFHFKIK